MNECKHLFVEQLLIFSRVAEEDVRQFRPDVVLLEETHLWKPVQVQKKKKKERASAAA